MARGIGLHIGLNRVNAAHYRAWDGALDCCEQDAEDMAAIARSHHFASTTLATENATAPAVLNLLDLAAHSLGSGDILLVTYSGHGGQLPDDNGDEPDSMDETWALYDRQLRDDELLSAWSRFAQGVRVLVVSDSCHSGSILELVMAAEEGVKAVPTDVARRTFLANREVYDRPSRMWAAPMTVTASVISIAACRDDEKTRAGPVNSAFTEALLQVWNGGAFTGSYSALCDAIKPRLPSQTPTYDNSVGTRNPSFETEAALTI
jgi:hypothetical protein